MKKYTMFKQVCNLIPPHLCHLWLNLQSFLPKCAVIDTAKFHDTSKARDVCAGLEDGEITIFDKAYIDFSHDLYFKKLTL